MPSPASANEVLIRDDKFIAIPIQVFCLLVPRGCPPFSLFASPGGCHLDGWFPLNG
jgi:hypothetical protein